MAKQLDEVVPLPDYPTFVVRANLADSTKAALAAGRYRHIARRVGCAPQHVSRVIKGERGASLHVAARIAAAAGVSLDQLYRFICASPKLNIKGRATRRDMRIKRIVTPVPRGF